MGAKVVLAAAAAAVVAAGGAAGATAIRRRGLLSLARLRRIMPDVSAARAAECLPYIIEAMREGGITTKPRIAAFLAQLAHESDQLRAFQEYANGLAYEGNLKLGNTQPGDGPRFKGRGPIQLTGRSNYEQAGRALKLDLVGRPELAAKVEHGFRIAVWYWSTRGLNALADAGDFLGITKKINGGTNGLADREKFHARALAAV